MISDTTRTKLRGAVRSKTQYLALALIVIGYLMEPAQQQVIASWLGPNALPRVTSLLGLVLMILRWKSTALEDKVEEPE